MKKLKFEVVGVNKITENLSGKIFELPSFVFSKNPSQSLNAVSCGMDYIIDLKSIQFLEGIIQIDCFVSGEDRNVGRISLKYLP